MVCVVGINSDVLYSSVVNFEMSNIVFDFKGYIRLPIYKGFLVKDKVVEAELDSCFRLTDGLSVLTILLYTQLNLVYM